MNTTNLKQDLDNLVRDVTPEAGFGAGVASKVRARKRARAAGVGVACVALLGLGVGVTTQLGTGAHTPAPATSGHAMPRPAPTMTGTDGMPTRAVPTRRTDVVKDGIRVRSQVGGDALVVGFIGDVGQGQATLRWDVTTTQVAIAAECYLPGRDAQRAAQVQVRVSLVGSQGFLSQGSCGTLDPREHELRPNWTPGEPGQGWAELTAGKPAGLRVQLVDARSGKPVAAGSARFAAAVYNLGRQRVVSDPRNGKAVAALPEVLEHQGYTYRLQQLVTGTPSRNQQPVSTPGGTPFLVTFGSAGLGVDSGLDPNGSADAVRLVGLDTDPGLVGGGGWQTVPQPSRAPGKVRLVREGTVPDTGADFVAIYALEQ